MKTIVIYQSKYGFTETYAKWIAEELSADIITADKVKPADLQTYHTIVLGGGLYAGGVSGISTLTKNYESIKDKALYLFTVGAADVTDKQNVDGIRSSLSSRLTAEMLQTIKIYHFRGGMNYSNMSLIHRAMMGMMMKMLRKKSENELRPEDKIMMETYGQDINFTNRSTIEPLVLDIKSLVH